MNSHNGLIRSLVFFVQLVILNGCTGVTFTSYRTDDAIDVGVRADIDRLDSTVIAAIRSNDPSPLLSILDTQLVNAYPITQLVREFNQQIYAATPDSALELISQIDITPASIGDVSSTTPCFCDDSLLVSLKNTSKHMFVSIYRTFTGRFDRIFPIVYHKVHGTWKVRNLHVGLLDYLAKSPHDWLAEAQRYADANKPMAAYLRLAVVRKLLHPAPYIQRYYTDPVPSDLAESESAIKESLALPRTYDSLPGRPIVRFLEPFFLGKEDLMFPLVSFTSDIPISDRSYLKYVSDTLASVLRLSYPDLGAGTTHLLFRAHADSTMSSNSRSASFVIKLE